MKKGNRFSEKVCCVNSCNDFSGVLRCEAETASFSKIFIARKVRESAILRKQQLQLNESSSEKVAPKIHKICF